MFDSGRVIMEVWFRSFSLKKIGDGCRFQPLIFQGVGETLPVQVILAHVLGV